MQAGHRYSQEVFGEKKQFIKMLQIIPFKSVAWSASKTIAKTFSNMYDLKKKIHLYWLYALHIVLYGTKSPP